MKQKFAWDRDRIAFFRDAAENSGFYRALAQRIAPFLRPEDCVTDAGCGLGYLSEALLPYCKSVTAVDIDEQAIAELAKRTSGIRNLYARTGDVHAIQLCCDVLVCCRLGSTEEAIRLFERSGARTLILVKRNDPMHRISDSKTSHERTASETVRNLSERGIPFSSETISLPFDQPFRSEADAIHFFSMYGSETDEPERFPLHRLIRTEDPVFPLHLPIRNDLTIFVIHP